jgi:peptidyl-prolyl cis-trans isomerase A (cyclophilin A)
MRKIACVVFLALLVAASLWGQAAPPKNPPAHPTTASTAAKPSLLDPASLKAKAPDVYRAKFTTTKGDFVVEVTRAWAPFGADRFYNLVKYHFYDGASLFRIVPGFVAQFGIPAKPEIARVWANANIQDDPVMQSNLPGYVTYAQTAMPNSRNTQVFINYRDNSALDRQRFAPFGKVVEGMDVVGKFYSGYGDNGPDQGRLTNEGRTYVDKSFPKLDSIKTAVIISPAPAATPGSAAKPKPTAGTEKQ